MRNWMTMMAVGAAMLIAAGSARAVERMDEAARPAGREMVRDARSVEPSHLARTGVDAMKTDRADLVTRDELDKELRALVDRLERERPTPPEPTFTDAG